jgi:hypothetical protein
MEKKVEKDDLMRVKISSWHNCQIVVFSLMIT